jgi:hypothetical protein
MVANEIIDRLKRVASDEKRKVQLRFFKTGVGEYGYGDEFLGVMVPQTRAIVKDVWQYVTLDEIETLLHSPYHEARLTALLLLVKIYEEQKVGTQHAVSANNKKQQIFEIYTSNEFFASMESGSKAVVP